MMYLEPVPAYFFIKLMLSRKLKSKICGRYIHLLVRYIINQKKKDATDNLVLENIDCLQNSAVVSHDDSYLTKMIVVHTTLTTTS